MLTALSVSATRKPHQVGSKGWARPRPRIEVTHSVDRHHNLAQGRHREADSLVKVLIYNNGMLTGKMTAKMILKISEQAIEVR